MNTDFGIISNYTSERGFGFVRGLLLGNSSKIFFHIKTINKSDPRLATILASDSFRNDLYFWFETEETPRGTQVRAVLSPEQIRRGIISEPAKIINRIECYWRNLAYKKPSWLDEVTSDLLGEDRADELRLERNHLEAEEQKKRDLKHIENEKKKAIEQEKRELERIEHERKKIIEQEKRQQQRDAERAQEQLEEKEFKNLVNEMKHFGFKHSSQVSSYIVSNRLGYKYKNISGILQMELDGTTWNFKGGFPPKIYAKLCDELGLSNNGTRARAVSFESFGNIEERLHGR